MPSSTDEEQRPDPVEAKEEVKTEPEEVDIDLTDPEVEAAAQKIQASFRGHLKSKRKQTISKEEESGEKEAIARSEKEDSSAIGGSPTIPSESSGEQKTDDKEVSELKEKEEEKEEGEKKEKEKEEEVIDMKPAEQTAEKVRESSGSVIEGDKADKNADGSTAEGTEVKKQEVPAEMKAATPTAIAATEVDIDLTNPDVAAATKKLQAGFRGRLNRRKKAQENALAVASTVLILD